MQSEIRRALVAHAISICLCVVGCADPKDPAKTPDASVDRDEGGNVVIADASEGPEGAEPSDAGDGDDAITNPPDADASGGMDGCKADEPPDCKGVCGGTSVVDECGVCGGNDASLDCLGECAGDASLDAAGNCCELRQRDCSGICAGSDRGLVYYTDYDRDGLGDPRSPVIYACPDAPQPLGQVLNGRDCDDRVYGCRDDCSICNGSEELRVKSKLTAREPVLSGLTFGLKGVTGLGDVNGDGVPDLAHGNTIIFLNRDGSARQVSTIQGTDLAVSDVHASLGDAVVGLGDLDGDRIPDLALGEPGYPSSEDVGRAWVILLTREGRVAAAFPLEAVSTTTGCVTDARDFGSKLATVELDGVGPRELAVAAARDCYHRAGDRDPHLEVGRIDFWAWSVSQQMPVRLVPSIGAANAPYGRESFGAGALASGEGPAAGSLLVGLGSDWYPGLWKLRLSREGGLAEVVSYGPALATLAGLSMPEPPIWVWYTRAIAPMVVPETAHQRWLISVVRTLGYSGPEERSLVLLEAADANRARRVHLTGLTPATDAAFGERLASLGDLDGDGLTEYAVLAPGDDAAGPDAGALYILGQTADCGDLRSASGVRLRDCDAKRSNGCETELTSTEHCGGCGVSCLHRPRATGGVCRANGPEGHCELACEPGFTDCNDDPSDGCETQATAWPHATGVQCGDEVLLDCDGGWGDCDGNVANGCETPTLADVEHCGSCSACPEVVEGGYRVAGCSNGVCVAGTRCAPHLSDMNRDPRDGCETCGADGQDAYANIPAPRVCRASERCVADRSFVTAGGSGAIDVGVCASNCPLGKADCHGDGKCDDDVTSLYQCGQCGVRCGLWSWRLACVPSPDGTRYMCD